MGSNACGTPCTCSYGSVSTGDTSIQTKTIIKHLVGYLFECTVMSYLGLGPALRTYLSMLNIEVCWDTEPIPIVVHNMFFILIMGYPPGGDVLHRVEHRLIHPVCSAIVNHPSTSNVLQVL